MTHSQTFKQQLQQLNMEPVKQVLPSAGIIDIKQRVSMVTTEKHPSRKKAGIKINVAPAVAEKFRANGWAK